MEMKNESTSKVEDAYYFLKAILHLTAKMFEIRPCNLEL